jgi:secreted PhoX family phosphatase
MKRREFLYFLGGSAALSLSGGLLSCSSLQKKSFAGLPASDKDELRLLEGLSSHILIKWQDVMSPQKDLFGSNNDYLAILPHSENKAWLWVNHEAIPRFALVPRKDLTKKDVDFERQQVGGSWLEILKNEKAVWSVNKDSNFNSRVTAATPLLWSHQWPELKTRPIGTLANCAGGVTPWGTILSCEENYDDFYGENNYQDNKKLFQESKLKWEKFYPERPENYGWVVEMNPQKKIGTKLLKLGRFAHEGATCVKASDNRTVVYMGDDANDKCVYKFYICKAGLFA